MLIAAAIILIPELLSGPHRSEIPNGVQRDETALHSFNIDLSKRAAEEVPAAKVPPPVAAVVKPSDNVLPPAELPAADAATPPATESASVSQPPTSAQPAKETGKDEPKEASSDEASVQTPPAEPAAAVEKSPAKSANQAANSKQPTTAASARTAAHGWAVQVGSFGEEAVAQRLARHLKEKGYTAFVMPFKTGAKTLYRVRVGPQSQRTAAEAVAGKLKAEGTPGSVVSHP